MSKDTVPIYGYMELSAIALHGLQQAEVQLEKAATRIASCGAGSLEAGTLDTVNLSAEMLALLSAQEQTSVNLQTLKTAAEINKNLIDVMA